MQKSVESRVLEYCEKHHMLEKGDGVVLGVSGGADSVCLLFLMLSLREKLDLKLHVVHMNHKIRNTALEDAAYVSNLCSTHAVPFYYYEADVLALAKERGCSTEEAGRQVRYEAFFEVLQKQGCQKIAVAHNGNDRAETMLFHLFRGTGLTGLTGIKPMREQICRPLLCLQRKEIEAYLTERKIHYCHDITNDSDDYTRNKIRHHIIPYAEKEIVPSSVSNMMRTANILAETEEYIEEQLQWMWERCVKKDETTSEGYVILRDEFLKEHSFLQKGLLLKLLKELSPGHKDIGAVHVEDVRSLIAKEGNGSLNLPYGIRADRQYDKVILQRNEELPTDRSFEDIVILKEEITEKEQIIPLGWGRHIYLKRIDCGKYELKEKDIPQNPYTKWFDYDKIIGCLVLRNRKQGDFLSVKGGEGIQHKKLKDYMITEKIPKARREEIPLLAEENHILWMVGYRISEYYKVDKNTKCILQVCFKQSNRITEGLQDGEEKLWQNR